ncbi:MAG: hypothetical protein QOE28_673 [Solirubrobacteraceae bacterium]|nr:hypothetical protein [Solirubrobacteraceae bacterium]
MLAAAVALGLAVAAPAAAPAQVMTGGMHDMLPGGLASGASIGYDAFTPASLTVLDGDTITWTNDSARRHNVTADDGSFASLDLVIGSTFAHRFQGEGVVAFHCSIHPFMRGTVDVRDLLMDAPSEPGAPGRPYDVAGHSSLAPGTPVTIEADTGGGFAPVAKTTVATDGGVQASFRPTAPAQLRAVSGVHQSPPVQLLVLDRKVVARAVRGRRGTVVRAQVLPASPGATVVLQVRRRERFGWWPEHTVRLGRDSRATFRLLDGRGAPARVVLTLADGATELARSATFRIGR